MNRCDRWTIFSPGSTRCTHFPEEVLDRAWKSVPPDWIDGEEDALEQLLERLQERCKRVPELIEACRAGRANPFPNWK